MTDPNTKNDLDRNPEVNGFDNNSVDCNPRNWGKGDAIVRDEDEDEDDIWGGEYSENTERFD